MRCICIHGRLLDKRNSETGTTIFNERDILYTATITKYIISVAVKGYLISVALFIK